MASTKSLQEIQKALAEIRKFIDESCCPNNNSVNSLYESIQYGVVDKFLFDRSKPDKNGFYSNFRMVRNNQSDLKSMLNHINTNQIDIKNNYMIMYRKVSNNWNYKVLKIFKNIDDQSTIDKYLLLL